MGSEPTRAAPILVRTVVVAALLALAPLPALGADVATPDSEDCAPPAYLRIAHLGAAPVAPPPPSVALPTPTPYGRTPPASDAAAPDAPSLRSHDPRGPPQPGELRPSSSYARWPVPSGPTLGGPACPVPTIAPTLPPPTLPPPVLLPPISTAAAS